MPGVLNNEESAQTESFCDNLLEYPQYTRPEYYEGMRVPEVLLSGHHKNIEAWRRQQSLLRTWQRRPDLLKEAQLTKKDLEFFKDAGRGKTREKSVKRTCNACSPVLELDSVNKRWSSVTGYVLRTSNI